MEREISLVAANNAGQKFEAAEAEERFNAAVKAYGDFLGRTIAHVCPKNLGLQFEDIKQEACVRLWRAFSSGREIPALASYIYKVAVTTTIDAVRRVKARREDQLNATAEELQDVLGSKAVAPEVSPQRSAEQHQIVEKVSQALARQPENRRRAVGLYLQGLSTQEIADLLGWTEAKARNLAYRGLKDLKNQLRAEGIEYDI